MRLGLSDGAVVQEVAVCFGSKLRRGTEPQSGVSRSRDLSRIPHLDRSPRHHNGAELAMGQPSTRRWAMVYNSYCRIILVIMICARTLYGPLNPSVES